MQKKHLKSLRKYILGGALVDRPTCLTKAGVVRVNYSLAPSTILLACAIL